MEERIAHVEGRLGEQSVIFAGLNQAMVELRQDTNARFAALSQVIVELRQDMNARFAQVDARFGQMDARFTTLDDKLERNHYWTLGLVAALAINIAVAVLK